MATKQGMCKNCGSLVMFDDRDELCECVFCNCVFPAEEAAKILENPDGYEFKNEKFEKNTQAGAKHYYSNPVMPDVVEKAVQREKTSKSQQAEAALKLKPSEFEISPNDVKAPTKLVIGMIAGIVLIIGIIVAIALPLYMSRKALRADLSADINKIFEKTEPDTVSYDEFDYKQFNIYGLSCQYIKLGLSGDITDEQAKALYDKYSALRAEKRGFANDDVEMYIYTPDTIYFASKDGVKKDAQPTVEILEPTETSK